MFSKAATPQKMAYILPAPVPDLLSRSQEVAYSQRKRVAHLAIHMAGEEKMEHFFIEHLHAPCWGCTILIYGHKR